MFYELLMYESEEEFREGLAYISFTGISLSDAKAMTDIALRNGKSILIFSHNNGKIVPHDNGETN